MLMPEPGRRSSRANGTEETSMGIGRRMKVALAAAALAGAAVAPLALSAGLASGAPSDNQQLSRQLAEVRRATAKYHNLDVALADGYEPFGEALWWLRRASAQWGTTTTTRISSTTGSSTPPAPSCLCTPLRATASGWSPSST